MTTLNWGIVSTGRISNWFVEDLTHVPNAKATAVCSRDEARAQQFAEKYGINSAYGRVADLLEDPTVDIVYIGTPHTQHKRTIIDALRAGKHVLCEKPLVTSVSDAELVLAAAQASGCYLMEAMWTYHLPAFQDALAWVQQGRIGTVTHIKSDFGYPVSYSPNQREYDINDAGGALREMGIYPIAIARAFLGNFKNTPDSLYTTHQNAPNGVEQDLTIVSRFGDVTVNLTTSYRARLSNATVITGDSGWITIPDTFRCHRQVYIVLMI